MSRLRVFGELLSLPIPLELSLDDCSYGCYFCFARLDGRPQQRFTSKAFEALVNQFSRIFSDATYDPTDLLHYLLRHRYPICYSNRVDPFGRSNLAWSRLVLELCRTHDVPLMLQTRANRDLSWLDWLTPKDTLYVSICTLDAGLAKRIEAGAPPPAVRLQALAAAHARGIRTQIGVNPYTPEWAGEPGPWIEAAQRAGVDGFVVEPLVFRPKALSQLKPPPDQLPVTLRAARLKSLPLATMASFVRALADAGFQVESSIGQPYAGLYQPIDWAVQRAFCCHDWVVHRLYSLWQDVRQPLLVPWVTIEALYRFPTQAFKRYQLMTMLALSIPHSAERYASWPPTVPLAWMARELYEHGTIRHSVWGHPWFHDLVDRDRRTLLSDESGLRIAVFDPTQLNAQVDYEAIRERAIVIDPPRANTGGTHDVSSA